MRATPARVASRRCSVERRPGSPWISIDLPRSIAAVATLLSVVTGVAAAQQVRGRLVTTSDSVPVGEALVLLLDSTRHEVARTASTASGGFRLMAPAPGRYTVRVQRIGYLAWEAKSPMLASGDEWATTLLVPEAPYSMPELVVHADESLCGVALGDADILARLLESAQTALGLAEAGTDSASGGTRRFLVQTWRRTVREDGTPLDSTPILVPRQFSGWPIRSADPESLRVWGFVRGSYPPPREVVPGPNVGPVYYGPDARVLFTPWFLDAHCFSIDKPHGRNDSTLVVRFKPAKHAGAAALAGRFEFDRARLELRVLSFSFVRQPGWVPRGAGGAMRFVRLPDGAWLPAWWRLRAPVAAANARKGIYEFFGFAETGGIAVEARRPDGTRDDEATAALTTARALGPPPP